jgi:hypothetical protein
MAEQFQFSIPVLTEIIKRNKLGQSPSETELLIAELQTRLASDTFALTERLLRDALTQMQAALYEQMTARLRRELPDLIDRVLREQLAKDNNEE